MTPWTTSAPIKASQMVMALNKSIVAGWCQNIGWFLSVGQSRPSVESCGDEAAVMEAAVVFVGHEHVGPAPGAGQHGPWVQYHDDRRDDDEHEGVPGLDIGPGRAVGLEVEQDG